MTPCLEISARSFHVTEIWLNDVAVAVTLLGPVRGAEVTR